MAYTTINKPSNYFDTKLYTGNGSTQTVTGLNFKPDWTWIKCRSAANGHTLWDSVRGVTKSIDCAFDYPEQTIASGLTAFNSDGFSLGSLGDVNGSGVSQVAWNWSGSGTTPVTNTQGSITSTVSANITSGFSVVKWTGTGGGQSNVTIGHGLGAVPKMIFFKQLDTGNWVIYHNSLGINNYLVLNSTAGSAAATGLCNPTSTNIVLPTSYGGTNSTSGELAYCFAEVKGYSKFGSYTGNSNADGTFVYTGFKPAFIMVKATGGAEGWVMIDNKRANPFNVIYGRLRANVTAAEETNVTVCDFLSNGFKFRLSEGSWNSSAYSYIYMAFAEQPLVGTNNVPATAR